MDEKIAESYIVPLVERMSKDDVLFGEITEAIKRAVSEWKEEEKSIQRRMRGLVRKELMKALERLKKEISF